MEPNRRNNEDAKAGQGKETAGAGDRRNNQNEVCV